MGKSSPSPPPTPDPAATAAAQGAANKETAIAQARLNQIEEVTPFGKSYYEKTGEEQDGIEMMRRITELTPEQQAIIDQQTEISRQLNQLAGEQTGRVSETLATPFSYEGMPAAPEASEEARQQVIDAVYGQMQSRLDPRFQDEQTALETQLANQGIAVGSDAYNKAMESFGRTRNDAYTSALNQAITSGGAEQSRLFGLGGSARERAIQEAAYLRNLPLSDISTLMGAAPGATMPQFAPIPQTAIANTDIIGPTYQSAAMGQNTYNQQMGAQNAMMGGLFGLGGSALGGYAGSKSGSAAITGLFSDRRVKRNIKKVGELDNGLPVYSYQYKWGGPTQIGVMAQDVEAVNPAAVGEVAGIKTVNYAEAVK